MLAGGGGSIVNTASVSGVRALHPSGRFADPVEIAQTVLWLLGSGASFVTGSAVFVDGGQTV